MAGSGGCWLAGWLAAGWLAGGCWLLAGWLAGWLAGLLAGCGARWRQPQQRRLGHLLLQACHACDEWQVDGNLAATARRNWHATCGGARHGGVAIIACGDIATLRSQEGWRPCGRVGQPETQSESSNYDLTADRRFPGKTTAFRKACSILQLLTQITLDDAARQAHTVRDVISPKT